MAPRPGKHLYRGEMRTVPEIAQMSGTSVSTIKRRRVEYGASTAEAADMPEGTPQRSKYVYNGEHMTLTQIARLSGVHRGTLYDRLHRGWTLEEAISRPADGTKRQTKGSLIEPPEGMSEAEKGRMMAAQQIAQTVATPDLHKWNFRQVAPGRYEFNGNTIDWTIRFLLDGRAELTAQVRNCARSSGFRRVFDVSGEKAKEIAPEWKPYTGMED